MSSSLRELVARELLEIDGLVPPAGTLAFKTSYNDHCREYLKRADRILAIPAIAEALEYRRRNRCTTPASEDYLGHCMNNGVCIECGITDAEMGVRDSSVHLGHSIGVPR